MSQTLPHNTQCHWQQDHLRFNLQTDDPAVAHHAEKVLRYWHSTSCTKFHPTESLTATVVQTTDGTGWQFIGSQSAEVFTYRDIPTVIRAVETDAALAVLNQPHQFLTVHSALLARGSDAVLIVGPSQSGKSTTSCALWAAGWQLLADDVTILNPVEATAAPLMRRVSLRHPSRDLLGKTFWQQMLSAASCDPTPEGYLFHPDEIEGRTRARSVSLRAILFLHRRGAPDPGPARLSPIITAQALLSLAPYTNVVHHGGMGEAISRLGPLLNQIPSYDLGRGPILAMTETISGLINNNNGTGK